MTASLAPTALPIFPLPSIASSQYRNHTSNVLSAFRDWAKSSSALKTRLKPRGLSRPTKNMRSSAAILRVGIEGEASEAAMAAMDELFSIASCAPSEWLKSVLRHLRTSDSIAA